MVNFVKHTRSLFDLLPDQVTVADIAKATGLDGVAIGQFKAGQLLRPDMDWLEQLHAFLQTHSHRSRACMAPAAKPKTRKSPTPNDIVKMTFSVPEAARALGVSERSIYNRIYDGTLKRVRVGRRVLIPAAALHALAGAA